jgi:hypothetical protein
MAGSEGSGPASPRLFVVVTGHLAVNVLLRPQLASLTAAGWEVHVVCAPGPLDAAAVDSVHAVHGLPMSRSVSPWRDVRNMLRLARLLRAERPVVVVGSTPKAALVSMVGARLARVPVRVFQVRGAPWEGATGRRATLTRLADRVAARSATDVLAVSSSLADVLVARAWCAVARGCSSTAGARESTPRCSRRIPSARTTPRRRWWASPGASASTRASGEILDVVETVRPHHPGAGRPARGRCRCRPADPGRPRRSTGAQPSGRLAAGGAAGRDARARERMGPPPAPEPARGPAQRRPRGGGVRGADSGLGRDGGAGLRRGRAHRPPGAPRRPRRDDRRRARVPRAGSSWRRWLRSPCRGCASTSTPPS